MKNKFLFLFFIALFVFGFSVNVYADNELEVEDTTIVTGSYDFNTDSITKSESDLNKEKWVSKPETLKQKLFLYISIGVLCLNFLFLFINIIGIIRDYNLPSVINKKE